MIGKRLFVPNALFMLRDGLFSRLQFAASWKSRVHMAATNIKDLVVGTAERRLTA